MTTPTLPLEGTCRCQRVQFRITAPPLLASACHCSGCQRMSASAFSLTLTVPKAGFELTAGETVQGGLRGPVAQHMFCDHCKTWMYTQVEGLDFVNVRPTMLLDASWFVPYVETWTGEKVPWATTPARHSFETQPDWEAYGRLAAEYQGLK